MGNPGGGGGMSIKGAAEVIQRRVGCQSSREQFFGVQGGEFNQGLGLGEFGGWVHVFQEV